MQHLIRCISQDNPLWGAPRVHGELLMLGIEVSQGTVPNYMIRQRKLPSQSWLTFLRNQAPVRVLTGDIPDGLEPEPA